MNKKIQVYRHGPSLWVVPDAAHNTLRPTTLGCPIWDEAWVALRTIKCAIRSYHQHRTETTALCAEHEEQVQREVRLKRLARQLGIDCQDLLAELQGQDAA